MKIPEMLWLSKDMKFKERNPKVEKMKLSFLENFKKITFPDYIIRKINVDKMADEINQYIQPIIGIDMLENKKVDFDSSKIGGYPYLPEGYKWPTRLDDEKDFLAFICQINMADVSKHDFSNLLPKKGMLYLFSIYDPDSVYGNEINDSTAKIIFIPNPKNLKLRKYPETLKKDGQFQEKQLSFSLSFVFQEKDEDGLLYPVEKRFDYSIENAIDKTLQNMGLNKAYLRMLGHPFFFRNEFIKDYSLEIEVLLLHIPGEAISSNFGEGEFHLIISKNQLKKGNLELASILFEVGT